MTTANPATVKSFPRLTSLDQFRGYTMVGMILVNYLGGYNVCPRILKHTHDYCSYADTIMPHFLFAAGFAMRLSLGRRIEAGGKMPWGRAIRRILGLALVAIAWYGYDSLSSIIQQFSSQPAGQVLYVLFKRQLLQTLLHIAITSLWILPVIAASWKVRLWYMIASGLLHVVLSWWFNFAWVYASPQGIDGGPLGFLTWAIPALCGTLACDLVKASGPAAATRLAVSGCGVMLLGWLISAPTVLYNVPKSDETSVSDATEQKSKGVQYAPDPVIPTIERVKAWDGSFVEPPFVPPPSSSKRLWNYWMMSQRGGTLSYPTFAAGVSLVVYALFLWLCDGMNWRLGLFRTLGTNSLAAYMLSSVAGRWVRPYFPKDSTEIWAWTAVACVIFLVYIVCRIFERLGWYIRV